MAAPERTQEVHGQRDRGERLVGAEQARVGHSHRSVRDVADYPSVKGPHRVLVLGARVELDLGSPALDSCQAESDEVGDWRLPSLGHRQPYRFQSGRTLEVDSWRTLLHDMPARLSVMLFELFRGERAG